MSAFHFLRRPAHLDHGIGKTTHEGNRCQKSDHQQKDRYDPGNIEVFDHGLLRNEIIHCGQGDGDRGAENGQQQQDRHQGNRSDFQRQHDFPKDQQDDGHEDEPVDRIGQKGRQNP